MSVYVLSFLCLVIVLVFWFVLWWRVPNTAQDAFKRYVANGFPPIKQFTFAKVGDLYKVYTVNNKDNTITERLSSKMVDLMGNEVNTPTFAQTNKQNGFIVDGIAHEFKCPDGFIWSGTKCENVAFCNNEKGTLKPYKNYSRGYIECGEANDYAIKFCTGYSTFDGAKCAPYDPCIDLGNNSMHNIGTSELGKYFICQGATSTARQCPKEHLFVAGTGCVPLNQCENVPDGTHLKINSTTFVTCVNGQVGQISKCPPNTSVNDSFNCAEICNPRVTKIWATDFYTIPRAGVICPENKEIVCGTREDRLPTYDSKIPLDVKYLNQAFVNGICETVNPKDKKYNVKSTTLFTYAPVMNTLAWDIFTNRPVVSRFYFLINEIVYDNNLQNPTPIKDVIPIVSSNNLIRLDTNPYFAHKTEYLDDKYAVGMIVQFINENCELYLYGLVKLTNGWRMAIIHNGSILVIDAEATAILPDGVVELNTQGQGAYCPPKYLKVPQLGLLEPRDSAFAIRFIDAYGYLTDGYGAPQWTSLLTGNRKMALIAEIPLDSSDRLVQLKSIDLKKWPATTTYPNTVPETISNAQYKNLESWLIPITA